MRLFDLFKMKRLKYSKAIYIWISLAISVIVMVYGVIISINVQQTLKESNDKVNEQVFSQIEYNMNYTDELIKNLCVSTYTNPDVISMMYFDFRDEDYYKTITTMDRIRTNVLNINQFIHSIYIYNAKTKTFYSTFNGINYKDDLLLEALKRYQDMPPVGMPIARKMISDRLGNQQIDVFTYVMYEFSGSDGLPEGAVYVNVYAQWVLDNIKKINTDSARENIVYLLDDKGEFVGEGQQDGHFAPVILSLYKDVIRRSIQEGITYETLPTTIQNEKYLVTYLYLNSANWTIFRIQSYDDIYGNIRKTNISILFITFFMLLITLVLSRTVSRKIYKPIGSLIREWKQNIVSEDTTLKEKDEMVFLHDVMVQSTHEQERQKRERYSNKQVLKTFYLRKLLLDCTTFSNGDLQKLLEGSDLVLDLTKPMRICFVRIDNYKLFQDTNSLNDRSAAKFGMMNIFTEVLSTVYPCEALDMKNDSLTLILNDSNMSKEVDKLIIKLLRDAQKYILEYLNVMTTIGISYTIQGIEHVTLEYNRASQLTLYRFVFGRMAVIHPSMIKHAESYNQLEDPSMAEKNLIEAIKYGNLSNVEEQLLQIMQSYSGLSHDHITLSIMRLVNTVRITVCDIQSEQLDTCVIDFREVYKKLMDFETVDDLYYEVMRIIRSIGLDKRAEGNDKHHLLIETISDYLLENYPDPGVCLAQIANMLKMSPTYIGRVYKEIKGSSVAEQLNEIRMQKAADFLDRTNASISQIVSRVGMENISHFYRKFKKRFGVTPKEYSLKKAVERI